MAMVHCSLSPLFFYISQITKLPLSNDTVPSHLFYTHKQTFSYTYTFFTITGALHKIREVSSDNPDQRRITIGLIGSAVCTNPNPRPRRSFKYRSSYTICIHRSGAAVSNRPTIGKKSAERRSKTQIISGKFDRRTQKRENEQICKKQR